MLTGECIILSYLECYSSEPQRTLSLSGPQCHQKCMFFSSWLGNHSVKPRQFFRLNSNKIIVLFWAVLVMILLKSPKASVLYTPKTKAILGPRVRLTWEGWDRGYFFFIELWELFLYIHWRELRSPYRIHSITPTVLNTRLFIYQSIQGEGLTKNVLKEYVALSKLLSMKTRNQMKY